ncbi:YqiJ family protein [Permianibacter aggregans]|uniref:Uncharacterized protein DUF1449 n=1 Tax=Permianibacter aggregans TaxID=1510150 RepID=A0A4R6UEE5_9GAMM|nr:YqiJ family protein [Permianibacter aggregans]QGX39674.1 DUF1449 family protein [Permianibacter aggregans]TDQ43205.1 uncharacterized protein DUF1449 [Permianibacter aggregans]
MFNAMFASDNLPFSVALVLMLIMLVAELASMMLGAGLSDALENLLPDGMDADAPDGADVDSSLSNLLGWLRFGQVPVLMLLVIFLTSFGLLGLFLQGSLHTVTGIYLPGWLASIPVFFASLPCVRLFGGWLAKILPKDETSVVSENSFIGRVAVITLGTARQHHPAEAKLRDEHGMTHYLMVEPDNAEEMFTAGTDVILTEKLGAVYRAIRNYNPHLSN